MRICSFTVFWIYTTLKLLGAANQRVMGFTVFWIYTTLKLWYSFIITTSKFYCILNLHYSQTCRRAITIALTVLLYSEFTLLSNHIPVSKDLPERFTVFWIYTTLKPVELIALVVHGFTVFWIYTTLKPPSDFDKRSTRFTVFWIYTTLKPLRR